MTELRAQPRRRVAELMSTPPLMVPADTTVAEAAGLLFARNVGAVLVGTPDELLGILSERDIAEVVAHGRDPGRTTVGDAMTSPVVHVDVGETILDAAVMSLDLGVRHLPVLDGDRVEGVVSVRDLVRPLLLEALTTGEPS